jgi:hypothetical protein
MPAQTPMSVRVGGLEQQAIVVVPKGIAAAATQPIAAVVSSWQSLR